MSLRGNRAIFHFSSITVHHTSAFYKSQTFVPQHLSNVSLFGFIWRLGPPLFIQFLYLIISSNIACTAAESFWAAMRVTLQTVPWKTLKFRQIFLYCLMPLSFQCGLLKRQRNGRKPQGFSASLQKNLKAFYMLDQAYARKKCRTVVGATEKCFGYSNLCVNFTEA